MRHARSAEANRNTRGSPGHSPSNGELHDCDFFKAVINLSATLRDYFTSEFVVVVVKEIQK